MKKKKWQRSPAVKGILLVLQYVLLGVFIFTGLFFLTLESHGLRLSDSSKDYVDSQSFVSTFYDATYDVTHGISAVYPYADIENTNYTNNINTTPNTNTTTNINTTTNTNTDANSAPVIDIGEFLNNEQMSFTNTSGLAYSVSDLEKWSEDYDTSSGKPVVICHIASSSFPQSSLSWKYYYADDFLQKVNDGDLILFVDPDTYGFDSEEDWTTESDLGTDSGSSQSSESATDESNTQLISNIKDDIRYGTLDEETAAVFRIKDEKGRLLYDSISLYQGYYEPTEKYAPQGGNSLLDILNSSEQWNGRIEEAFEGLYNALYRTAFCISQKNTLETYSQGHSNMSYLYINEDDGRVLSNDDELVKKLNYDRSQSNTLQDFLDAKEGFSYILIQSKPGGFSSNLGGLSDQNTFPGNNITYSSWKDMICSMFPEVSDNFIFAAYVDQTFPVSDTFSTGKTFFQSYSRYLRPVFLLFLLCGLLLLTSFIWLTVIAGRNNHTSETVSLCFFDRWPTELSAGLVLIAWFPVSGFLLQNLPFADYQIARLQASLLDTYLLLKLLLLGLYTLFWFQIGYLSLVRRFKAEQLWKNSLLRRILYLGLKVTRTLGRKFHTLTDFYSRNTAARLKVTFAFFGFLFLKYLIFVLFLGSMRMFFLSSFCIDLLLLLLAIKKAAHREQIIKGLKEISGGNLQYKIPLKRLTGDDKIMAEYINNIGSGLDAAVENSVKNERMKTELITNVSHDLKTPLTSIISYIDLLKRENFTDPKVLEYLDILEAKAARLKVLTEDVVEASKASTGNLTLDMTDIDLVEMLHQVIGEFEDRFQEHHLSMMVHFPDEPSVIYADGRRMWRVLENIFGNVIKYAMEGTRVYAEVQNSKNQVIFSLKNISAQPLNFAAEELTERFVRGDVARNTEGSGLGLSIAKSLTELQGGKFQIYLDGDLFKVTITFTAQTARKPEASVPVQPNPDVR